MQIWALDSQDERSYMVKVAGPAALLVAKTIKIADRLVDAGRGQSARVIDKDALDILRLLQEVPLAQLKEGLGRHPAGSPAQADVRSALATLRAYATAPDSAIPQLALRASNGDPTVPASLAALVSSLLSVAGGEPG